MSGRGGFEPGESARSETIAIEHEHLEMPNFAGLASVMSGVRDDPSTAPGAVTPEAARRDAFIRREAPKYAWRSRRAAPVTGDLARYFREDARNAIAHVRRSAAREIDPDDPDERVRLSDDADWLHDITRAAVRDRWPDGVRRVEH